MYILVVDDDCFANTLVQFVLTKEGYEVETTDNPRGAMQMIQKREPDLLILDVMMPYINGFEFSEKLRADGYETPLIFMTGMGKYLFTPLAVSASLAMIASYIVSRTVSPLYCANYLRAGHVRV